jgi:hypothetical protein
MATTTLTADQQVAITLQFVDKYNNPVTTPTGVPTWSVDHPEWLQINASADGLSAQGLAVGPIGTAVVTVSLDGVSGTESFEVTPGAVASVTLVVAAPTVK